MTDTPILCPYCGAEMIPPGVPPLCPSRPRAYHCDECGAIAPTPLLPEGTADATVYAAAATAARTTCTVVTIPAPPDAGQYEWFAAGGGGGVGDPGIYTGRMEHGQNRAADGGRHTAPVDSPAAAGGDAGDMDNREDVK